MTSDDNLLHVLRRCTCLRGLCWVHSQPALSLQVSTVPMRPAGVDTMMSGGSRGGPSLGFTYAVRTRAAPDDASLSLSAADTTCRQRGENEVHTCSSLQFLLPMLFAVSSLETCAEKQQVPFLICISPCTLQVMALQAQTCLEGQQWIRASRCLAFTTQRSLRLGTENRELLAMANNGNCDQLICTGVHDISSAQ